MQNPPKSKRFLVILISVVLVSFLLMVGMASAKSTTKEPSTSNVTESGEMETVAAVLAPSPQVAIDELMAASNGTVKLAMNNATGVVRFASFGQELDGFSSTVSDEATAVAQAEAFIATYGAAFGIQDAANELSLVDTSMDNFGFTHVHYVQLHENVDVYASTLRVHFNESGRLTAVNGTIIPKIKASAEPKLSSEQAADIAIAAVNGEQAAKSWVLAATSNVVAENNDLLYYNTGLIQSKVGDTVLAYLVEVTNYTDIREFVFVDAQTGAIVDQIAGIHEGVGADREVSETSLANVIWDESNGDPDPIPGGWAGGTAQQVTDWQNEIDGAVETYNLIDNLTGGTYASYDGAEATMRTVNNDPNISCPNANWNGISTNYCSGVTGDDTVAHEWGHAYTEYTHGLVYAWQPGALNESYSDIWGEVVDLINGRGTDSPGGLRTDGACSIYGTGSPSTDDTYRWLSGEDDPAFGGAIRDMWNPTCYGDPGKVTDTQYWCTSGDSGGVHTNSGVPNHAFALLVDGGTYNGQTITGIGLDKAAYIYWRAQAVYQSVSSDFPDHASSLAQSCTDLIGAPLDMLSTTYSTTVPLGSSISAADCTELDNVITAVEFNTAPDQCGFEPAFETAPALCDGQGTGVVNSIYTQDWETSWAGWVTGTHDIANPSSFDNPDWVVRGSLPDGRGGNAMYVEDSINRGACTPSDTVAGALNLDTPTFTVPAGVTVTRVAIDHLVSTETGWDGGNVKISVNGGAWEVLPDIVFEVNGYFAPGAINGGGNDNPLAGEEGFTGGGEGSVSTGWGQSQLNLTGYVNPGDDFQLRFDMGLDGCNGVDGWYVDEFEVYSCEEEQASAVCGDGMLDIGETCDDGNTENGDGCSDVCQVEDGWTCEDPVPPNPDGTNVVADWSFEGGVPNAEWDAFSSFTGIPGFPLCGPDNGCPAAGVATTGDWSVWIGGLSSGVTSTVSQTINIPSTALTMTLQSLRGVCDDPSDTLYVLLDGNTIGTQACDAVDGDFNQLEFSVAGYNDDSDHSLVIGGTDVGGTNGTHSNFFVDDVVLYDNVPTSAMPSDCSLIEPETFACNATVAFLDGIPENWMVVDVEGNGVVWSDIAGSGESGNYTNGSGDAASVSSDAFGQADFDTWLVTPVFTLTDNISATLDYSANYQNFANEDFLDLDITTNGGVTWTTLLSWNEDHGTFRGTPGEDVSIDLSAYLGMSGLQLRWRYHDPADDDFEWYAQVDDVSLSCGTDLPAAIEVSPDSMSSVQPVDTQVTQTLIISNTGEQDLEWMIDEVAATLPTFAPALASDMGSREGSRTDATAPVNYVPEADFFEGFDDITNLPGWATQNNPDSAGLTEWFQGNDAVFVAHSGAITSYIGANFNNTGGTEISNWLMTPEVDFTGGSSISFWTRTGTGSSWPDRLQVRVSTNGSSTDVGTGPSDVGDFTNLELDINDTLTVGGYPEAWTQFTVDLSAYAGQSGRVAFRYYVPTSAGPTGSNSNYIGIDTVEFVEGEVSICDSPADISWLSVNPASGTTSGLSSTDVEVTYDSTGMAIGVYTGTLCIDSNDSLNPEIIIPVEMEVTEAPVTDYYIYLPVIMKP